MNLKIAQAILKKLKPDEMEDLGSYFSKHYPAMFLEELVAYNKKIEKERDSLKKKCADYEKVLLNQANDKHTVETGVTADMKNQEIPWPETKIPATESVNA